MKEPEVRAILHPAFEDGSPPGVQATRLTDRHRLGLVLQGAALTAHLERAGWHLPEGWRDLRLRSDGAMVLEAAPGPSPEPVQKRLRELLTILFGGETVAGRGQARRAARLLLERWGQWLTPLSPDGAVADVLEAAPFLWGQGFEAARRSLVCGLRGQDGQVRCAIAGPQAFRRRLLARLDADLTGESLYRQLQDLINRDGAALWPESGNGTAHPGEADLLRAQRLYDQGRFEQALEAVRTLRSRPARLLRARCQLYLGKLGACAASLRRLAEGVLCPAEAVEVAEIACRALPNLGDMEGQGKWVERAWAACEGLAEDDEIRLRCGLLAAGAAWDQQLPEESRRRLEAAAPAQHLPQLAWRWHQGMALLAMTEADGEAVVRHLGQALGEHRRRLRGFEASALWNDLGIGRAQLGDLAGAERAFLHAQRLLSRCEGPRRTTLTLSNLAEVRLRRGRLLGVRRILERSMAENRLSANLRGLIQDYELWARYEMVLGRFEAARLHLQAALNRLSEAGREWRRPQLYLLSARVLGWLRQPRLAAEHLAQVTPEAFAELEPEERPAVWALAGNREQALREAAVTPLLELWVGLLTGREIPEPQWQALETMEEFRAARLVFDAETSSPGAAPVRWVRRAAATFRRLGAAVPAQQLEARDQGPWRALERFHQRRLEGAELGPAVGDLLREAGYTHFLLGWTPPPEVGSVVRERVLAQAGDEESASDQLPRELTATLPDGSLRLWAPVLDPTLNALFAMVVQQLSSPAAALPESRERAQTQRRQAAGILGDSPGLVAAYERLSRLAAAEMPVLILGESGTGKERAARQIHETSRRARRPFLPINCAALTETLITSELFGHVRGAFTGADRDHVGIFESAAGGTVFLDEIGDLPLSCQGMLLRVLQESEVRRLGESLPRRVDVRVVAATHRDLLERVSEGLFRQDLYYRLKVGYVILPPLRERGSDVIKLAEHFLSRSERNVRLSPAGRAALLAHAWPGNVRELENVITVAAALSADGMIEPEHLDLPARRVVANGSYHQQVESFRRRLVREALADSEGNQSEAARRLGLSRQALSYLVRQLEL